MRYIFQLDAPRDIPQQARKENLLALSRTATHPATCIKYFAKMWRVITHSSVSMPRLVGSGSFSWAKRGIGTAFKYLSFYKYTEIHNPEEMQRQLMRDWGRLALGRVYVASGTIL